MSTQAKLVKKITENLWIGEYDILGVLSEDIRRYDQFGIETPIICITAVINLSSRRYNADAIPLPDVNISDLAVPQSEPMVQDYAVHRGSIKFAAECVSDLIYAGNVVLLVCDTGRIQSAVVAVKYLMITRQPYDGVEFSFLTESEKERYIKIRDKIKENSMDDKFVLELSDKNFYTAINEKRICLSSAYKQLLEMQG